MLTFFTGLSIVILYALRPFVYKPASKELDPAVSSYFTAVWCLLFAVPTIPFCRHYFFIDDRFVFFYAGDCFSAVKRRFLVLFHEIESSCQQGKHFGIRFLGRYQSGSGRFGNDVRF